MKKRINSDLVKHLQWVAGSTPPVNPSSAKIPDFNGASFSLSDEADFWRISGVPYKGTFELVDLSKSLLDESEAHTQDEWAAHYIDATSNDEFYTPDFPLIYGIVKALYGAHDKVAETATVQNFLRTESRARWLMTLSRIAYKPTGNDLISHNYGTPDKYEQEVDFITPDEKIINTSKPDSYQTLLGTPDSVQDINAVFHWLNGTDTFAWKINSKPSVLEERVARFGANSGSAYLDCYWDAGNRDASLGVRVIRRAGATTRGSA